MAERSRTSRARYLAEWADKKRAELIRLMGGRCEFHGQGCKGELEFHHPFGRDYEPSDFSRWQRIIKYRREWGLGLLILRCERHNRKDNRNAYEPKAGAIPF